MEVRDCWQELLEKFNPTQSEIKELVLTPYARFKLLCYINLVGKYEVTGFGRVLDGKIIDIKILKQTVLNASVNCDEDSMLEFLMSVPKEEQGQWILDWHSHVEMNVFHSATDTDNYKSQWEARMGKQYPTMVVNKHEEYYVNQYINPHRLVPIDFKIDHSPLELSQLETIYSQCKKDVEELVEVRVVTYTTTDKRTKVRNKHTDCDWWDVDNNYKKPKGRKQLTLNDYFCFSCGNTLESENELTRGICDDCWEAMSLMDRRDYCDGLNLPAYHMYDV